MRNLAIYGALLLTSLLPLQAATLEVNSTADTTDGTCNAANCTLREAIHMANYYAAGDDTITFKSDLSGAIIIDTSLPALSSNISIEGPGANILSISGNGSTAQYLTLRPFTITGGGVVVTISGLKIEKGYLYGGFGAGISNASTLTIRNCHLSANSAGSGGGSDGGGAIANTGNLRVENCFIDGNATTGNGGAIYNSGTLTIDKSILTSNTSRYSTTYGDGGGIYNTGTLNLTNSSLTGNVAGSSGGGLYSNNKATIDATTIAFNTVSAHGGGISNRFGSLLVTNSTINNNTSGRGGGISSLSASLSSTVPNPNTTIVRNCTLSNNSAFQGGDTVLTVKQFRGLNRDT